MNFLQSLLDNSSVPVITAFILGILTAVSPCPLATNITAIGFISKDIDNHHRIFINGLLYTFGRIVTYTILGFILIPILREGASMFLVQKAISKYGEMLIAPGTNHYWNIHARPDKTQSAQNQYRRRTFKRQNERRLGSYVIRDFIRPCFLSYQWSVLFRYAHAFISSRNRRLPFTRNLCHCYRIARNPCRMDFGLQRCRIRQVL